MKTLTITACAKEMSWTNQTYVSPALTNFLSTDIGWCSLCNTLDAMQAMLATDCINHVSQTSLLGCHTFQHPRSAMEKKGQTSIRDHTQEQNESSIDDERRALYMRLQPTSCTIKSLAVYAVDSCFILVTATVRVRGKGVRASRCRHCSRSCSRFLRQF